MSTFVVSLKYAPGLAKEFRLIGAHLAERGHDVHYVLSSGYEWMVGSAPNVHYLTTSANSRQMIGDALRFPVGLGRGLKRLFAGHRPDFLCLYNPHPLNSAVARLARRRCPEGLRTIYLHEPYKPDKASFGLKGSLYFTLVEVLQTRALRETTCIVVPSPHALELFQERYPKYGRPVHVAPLLIPDDGEVLGAGERRYVSLVGTMNRSRGLDLFLDLVNLAAAEAPDLRFRLVTRSNIGDALDRLSAAGREAIEVVNKPQITDAEIAETIAHSFGLLLPHKQVTQSGNVPVSFRSGTPIIARDLRGFSQHVRHRENGYLLPVEATPADLLQAACYVRDHFAELSAAARSDFEQVFGEQNWERYYDWVPKSDGAQAPRRTNVAIQ